MVDEVKKLIEMGISSETLIYYGLEYKFIALYLTGKISYQEMVRDLEMQFINSLKADDLVPGNGTQGN